jgi:hypothetical protein
MSNAVKNQTAVAVEQRRARLEAALRENLRKRKQQARSRMRTEQSRTSSGADRGQGR